MKELPEAHELKEPDDAGIANTIFRGPATVACRAALVIVAVTITTISTTGFCLCGESLTTLFTLPIYRLRWHRKNVTRKGVIHEVASPLSNCSGG